MYILSVTGTLGSPFADDFNLETAISFFVELFKVCLGFDLPCELVDTNNLLSFSKADDDFLEDEESCIVTGCVSVVLNLISIGLDLSGNND
ncbi:hypothetical protein WICPIJ_007177 [Wickerhamomyces pijperi]|uniref:Uncharacterized protein n=1 Tax=Wickerhamomyces pijperi TaxID=599730 RepID=A0A9P8TK71_WICPI|nr:hypothetical protein WICPIJ_007177 [Wickerhamomyces pijperi]